jgi:hypothetical protein
MTNQSTEPQNLSGKLTRTKSKKPIHHRLSFDLTANSPTSWTIMLTAISDHCGSNSTPVSKFETSITDTEVNKCMDDTKVLIQRDFRTLQRLNLTGSNFVGIIWEATSKLYGGTDKFKDGVINDIDNF